MIFSLNCAFLLRLSSFTASVENACSSFERSGCELPVSYLCRNDQSVEAADALHALLCCTSEAERSAGSSHLPGAVNVAELVELDLVFRQIVF